MAGTRDQPASSSKLQRTYHVFLSFRGEDTRYTFTDHLYAALKYAGIHTFRDDDEIQRGGNIYDEIKRVVLGSEMSVIVFSKDYASSQCCLDELVMIMELRRTIGHVVIPVFYHVDPSDISEQTGSFREAFARHEELFKKDKDKVKHWRADLKEVADLGGLVLKAGYEAQFIQKIVDEVSEKLNRTILHVPNYLVGIDSSVEDINIWLQDAPDTDAIAVIYGIGGVGKTTIAKIVYNQNFENFEGQSFLANVRETSGQFNGLVQLQRQILSDILKKAKNKIHNVDEGVNKIKEAIRCKKVLIILDDVDQLEQFNSIIGMKDWLFPGSKIIITTRHQRLLNAHEHCKMFRVKQLDDSESLQLFSWHAFQQTHPVEAYMKHSKMVVHCCGGLPLVLQVLGSSLADRDLELWNSAIKEPEAIDDGYIQKTLQISYDSLQDDRDKNLFLDIACFFIGKDKDYVIRVVEGCDFYRNLGLQKLIDRFLITIEFNQLMMHQSLRDMAREIVRQESPEELGNRSRLWCHEDAFNVLTENTGTENIRSLMLNQHPRTAVSRKKEELKAEAFTEMHKLKLLQLNYTAISGDYKNFSKSLVWLSWHGFPSASIPTDFLLEKLVVLDLCNSSLTCAWEGFKSLPKLKILDLSHSHLLVRTPNFAGVGNLERLQLKGCSNLVDIDESIGSLKRLVFFNLKDCTKLKQLSSKIGMLKSLKTLILSGCSELAELPQELVEMKLLEVFYADGIGTNQFHSTIGNTISQKFLPCSLVKLSLQDCNISVVPYDMSSLASLQHLYLCGNPISALPESMKSLPKLESLHLLNCDRLHSIPELPTSLQLLMLNDCASLKRVRNQPNLLTSLHLILQGCKNLVEVQGLVKSEQIRNTHKEMIDNLMLFNSKSLETERSHLISLTTGPLASRGSPIQVLHECGIFSIFVEGSNIPDWYTYRNNRGSEISFKVPQLLHHKVHGLNLCIVYDLEWSITARDLSPPYAIIKNETKGWKRIYSPMVFNYCMGTTVLWLSHWTLGNLLETGDQVNVSVAMAPNVGVKKVGVHIMRESKKEGAQTSSSSYPTPDYQTLADVDLSAYQVAPHTYYFCHWKTAKYAMRAYNFGESSSSELQYPCLCQEMSADNYLGESNSSESP